VGTLVQSFALWPLGRADFVLPPDSLALFEQAFASFALLSFLFAAPALVLLYVVDLALGMVNRFAPQLNLISISMSLKSVGATLVWALMFAPLVDAIETRIDDALAGLLPALQVWLP
jgi:type III secretion protein T